MALRRDDRHERRTDAGRPPLPRAAPAGLLLRRGRPAWLEWKTGAPPPKGGLLYFDRVYGQPGGFYGALANADGKLIDAFLRPLQPGFCLACLRHLAEVLPERGAGVVGAQRPNSGGSSKPVCKHTLAGFEEDEPRRLPSLQSAHASLRSLPRKRGARDSTASPGQSRRRDCAAGHGRGYRRDGRLRDSSTTTGAVPRRKRPYRRARASFRMGMAAPAGGTARNGRRSSRPGGFSISREIWNIPERNVIVMTLLDDFSVADPTARLWAADGVAERRRSDLRRDRRWEKERYLASAGRAWGAAALSGRAVRGLWRDKQKADGPLSKNRRQQAPSIIFFARSMKWKIA